MKLRSFIFITLIVCVLFFNWSERVTGNGFQEPTKHVEGVKESEVTNNSTPSQSPGLREYRFLATNKSSTMEKELNQLADQGFGLELVAKEWNGGNMSCLLSRSLSAGEKPRFEYKLLATRKTGTLEKELLEVAEQGYELRGLVSVERGAESALGIGGESVIFLEREQGKTSKRFEYKLLSTRKEKTLQKELKEVGKLGYQIADLTVGQDTNVGTFLFGSSLAYTVIVYRKVGSSSAELRPVEYRFLETVKTSTMEKEINKAAKEGFRFEKTSPGLISILYRDLATPPKHQFEYKLLATQKTSTMQKELQEQANLGWVYRGQSSGPGGIVSLLERSVAAGTPAKTEYKLLATLREPTTQKEMNETIRAGYSPVSLTTVGEFLMILKKDSEK